ncbi:peptide deformylase [Nesterenkonia sp.]|uniref:peptide deformylase n=1 Tax=Nesterenkonia sp. TaxID=704201 RepID=UPI002622B039|nr:peptide deformylase [Nesterenkonia sp.]
MPVLTIRQIGDPVLRTPASAVQDPTDSRIRTLIADMFATMDHASGIGLAAPQVGIGLRIFTWDVEGSRGAVINPQLELSGPPGFVPRAEADGQDAVVREGCLSVRGPVHGPVSRHPHAVLTGVDETGQPIREEAENLLAACFQHEVDHLDGTLFIDRLTGDRRREAMRALRSLETTP